MKRIALLLALTACPSPATPQPDSGDAAIVGDAGICAAMCSNLAAIGCLEGADPKCVAVCTHETTNPVTGIPVACWASASTKEAARACSGAKLACP